MLIASRTEARIQFHSPPLVRLDAHNKPYASALWAPPCLYRVYDLIAHPHTPAKRSRKSAPASNVSGVSASEYVGRRSRKTSQSATVLVVPDAATPPQPLKSIAIGIRYFIRRLPYPLGQVPVCLLCRLTALLTAFPLLPCPEGHDCRQSRESRPYGARNGVVEKKADHGLPSQS